MKYLHIIIFTILCLLTNISFSQSGWFSQYIGINASLNQIFFINPNTGYIAGEYGIILKTTNAGDNWFNQQSCFGISAIQNAIFFVDANTGYITGYTGSNNGIGKTTNGGQNWFISSPYTPFLNTLFFTTANTGYVGGSYGYFRETTNGGINWIKMDSLTEDHIQSIYFTDLLTGYAVGGGFDSGVVMKTTNGGTNWYKQSLSEKTWLRSVYFINSMTGYIAGILLDTTYTGPAIILKTSNGGTNWTTQLRGGGFYELRTLYFNNVMTGYAGGSNQIIKTTNGGLNWYPQINPDFHLIQSIFFTNINTGFAINNTGLIFKTTNGGEPIGIKKISSEVPESYSLYQNYPNPFNPATKIRFSIPSSNNDMQKGNFFNTRLIIYNILGQEIETLLNQQLKPGDYEVYWDGINYESGVYFYKLIIKNKSSTYSQTKKMIMIK